MRATWRSILILLLCAGCGKESSPRISCKQPSYDFGVMPNSKPIEHAFLLRNNGRMPLQIYSLKACCGVTPTIADMNLAPGATTKLSVKMSLRGLRGKQSKTIVVDSNDPKHPQFELSLTGEAMPTADFRPRMVNFGDVRKDQLLERQVVLFPNFAFQIKKVVPTVPKFAASYEKISGDNFYRITIRTAPPLPAGLTSGMIQIFTDKAEYQPIDIPVVANVSSDLFIVPSEILIFELPGQQEPISYRAILRSRNNQPFKILEIISPNSDIKVKHSPLESAGYRIEIENMVAAPGLNGKQILIKTDHPGTAEIELPIRIIAQTHAGL